MIQSRKTRTKYMYIPSGRCYRWCTCIWQQSTHHTVSSIHATTRFYIWLVCSNPSIRAVITNKQMPINNFINQIVSKDVLTFLYQPPMNLEGCVSGMKTISYSWGSQTAAESPVPTVIWALYPTPVLVRGSLARARFPLLAPFLRYLALVWSWRSTSVFVVFRRLEICSVRDAFPVCTGLAAIEDAKTKRVKTVDESIQTGGRKNCWFVAPTSLSFIYKWWPACHK